MRRKKAGGGWENVKPNDERMSAPPPCLPNQCTYLRQAVTNVTPSSHLGCASTAVYAGVWLIVLEFLELNVVGCSTLLARINQREFLRVSILRRTLLRGDSLARVLCVGHVSGSTLLLLLLSKFFQ